MKQRITTTMIVALKLVITLLLLKTVLYEINSTLLRSYWAKTNTQILLLAFLLQNLSLISSSFRSRLYLNSLAIKINHYQNIGIYYLGTFYNNFLPGGIGGDGYKIFFFAKHHGAKKLVLLKTFFSERLNGLFALIYISLALSVFSPLYQYTIIKYVIISLLILALPLIPSHDSFHLM